MRSLISLIVVLMMIDSLQWIACSPVQPAAQFPASVSAASVTSEIPAATPPAENSVGLPVAEKIQVPVSLYSGGKAEYTVAAWLTFPSTARSVVLITVPGSTYGHTYWDFPYKPETYSFVRKMGKAGYTSLNIDRIGSGASSRPDANITAEMQGWIIHQLVDGLRTGSIGGRPYSKVVLVGHSLGSCEIIQEAATYGDVDGLIITGLLHFQSFPGSGLMSLSAAMQNSTASDDPIFKGIPTPSYTTLPGKRGEIFYNMDQTDPAVLKIDEETKVTTPVAENSAFRSVSLTDNIKVPVLIVVGEMDSLFIATPGKLTLEKVINAEKKYFQPSADLDFFILPLAGHDVNLHYNANLWYDAAAAWVDLKMK